MKPNLWVVGDSFVMPNMKTTQWIDKTKAWPYLLGKSLNVDATSVIGQYGCANTYICYEMKKNSIHMKPNDYLVVVTTSYTRQWFFFDQPQYTSAKVLFDKMDKEHKKAVEQYYTYLDDNGESKFINLENMIAWCHIFAQKKNLRLAIIPCFEWNHLHTCLEGSLYQIDANEHGGGFKKQKWLDDNNKKCTKDCHLSFDNHIILSQKLTDFLTHNKEIDLSNGFVKDLF